jgi:hypothetical protein
MAALARDHPKVVSERPRQRLVHHPRLADIALDRSDHDATRSGYQQALPLYQRAGESYSIGWAHRRLARLTPGAEREAHLAAAREAWRSIDRPDLPEPISPIKTGHAFGTTARREF